MFKNAGVQYVVYSSYIEYGKNPQKVNSVKNRPQIFIGAYRLKYPDISNLRSSHFHPQGGGGAFEGTATIARQESKGQSQPRTSIGNATAPSGKMNLRFYVHLGSNFSIQINLSSNKDVFLD